MLSKSKYPFLNGFKISGKSTSCKSSIKVTRFSKSSPKRAGKTPFFVFLNFERFLLVASKYASFEQYIKAFGKSLIPAIWSA